MRKAVKTVKRPKAKPEGPGVITTYAELEEKARKFAEGRYNLVVVAGEPGLSKSWIIKQALIREVGNDFAYIEANTFPFGAHVIGWRKRNKLMLIDDADTLMQTAEGRRWLKQIGQTEKWKHISRPTKALMGGNAPAPTEYWTCAKVWICTNRFEFRAGNIHSRAVEDRGLCYLFAPSALEIHRYVSRWYWDQEVFDAVAAHMPFLRRLSVRLYYKCWELEQAGDHWMSYIRDHCFMRDDTEWHVIELLRNRTLSAGERERMFIADGHGCRATWYRYRADLEERMSAQEIPYLEVQGKPPEDLPDPMAGLPGGDEEKDGKEGERAKDSAALKLFARGEV